MRVAAGSAFAARPIAQILRRVVIALTSPSPLAVKLAELGKVRVNRSRDATLLAETAGENQAVRIDRSAVLTGPTTRRIPNAS